MIDSAVTPVRPHPVHHFLASSVKFLLVAMPLTCAVLMVPAENWLLELLRHFRLWCAGFAAFLFVLAMILRLSRWLPLAALTFVWQGAPWYSYRSGGTTPVEPKKSFTLINCNLLYEARDPARMIALLREADADVLVFTEFTPSWQAEFNVLLWPHYPYRVEEPQPGAAGICLASRLPLEAARLRRDLGGFPIVSAAVLSGGSKVALLGVHPMPPVPPEGYAPWRAAIISWPSILREVNAPHRIITGDFNATPFCRTFQELCRSASVRESNLGFGIASTWFPGSLPAGLPLDHVLVSEKLAVVDYSIGPEAGSDHRWVKVRLALP